MSAAFAAKLESALTHELRLRWNCTPSLCSKAYTLLLLAPTASAGRRRAGRSTRSQRARLPSCGKTAQEPPSLALRPIEIVRRARGETLSRLPAANATPPVAPAPGATHTAPAVPPAPPPSGVDNVAAKITGHAFRERNDLHCRGGRRPCGGKNEPCQDDPDRSFRHGAFLPCTHQANLLL
jgi:hypothetical protein